MKLDKKDFTYNIREVSHGDLKIVFISDDMTRVSGKTDIHMHSFFELFFVNEGTLTVKSEGESYTLGENTAMIIPCGTYHSSSPEPFAVKTSVFFAFEYLRGGEGERLFSELSGRFSASGITVFSDAEYIGMLLGSVLENMHTEKLGRELRIKAGVTDLIFHLYDRLENNGVATAELTENTYWGYKYEIDRLFDSYYASDLCVELLSEKLFVSPRSVTRIIRTLYGKSFNELKLELKIRNAKRLLSDTDKSLEEISSEIGYSTLRGFLSAFVKYEGVTPSAYRKENSKK